MDSTVIRKALQSGGIGRFTTPVATTALALSGAFEGVRKMAQNVDRVSFLSANFVAAMNIQLATLAPNGERHIGLRVCL